MITSLSLFLIIICAQMYVPAFLMHTKDQIKILRTHLLFMGNLARMLFNLEVELGKLLNKVI